MKAAVLMAFGTPLAVTTVPDPVLRTGEVVVDVAAAGVLPYAAEVFSGARRYLLEAPVVPGVGAIGRLRDVGPDATHLKKGDWVVCDPTVRARDDARTPDITLQGWSARGEGGLRLQRYYHDGPFAQRVMVPTENAVPIGSIDAADAGRWCALNLVLVPYGGLLAADLQAGETVAISGATGNYGSAGVAVALSMGAGCVIAPGRNQTVLNDLARRFGRRVRTVVLSGNETDDRERIKAAAPDGIDCVLDLLPPSASATAVRAVAMTVREAGRVVLMGGVGMLGGDDLALPYPWIMRNNITLRGRWMYEPQAVVSLISLIRSELLNLAEFDVTEFPLDAANDAVTHAAAHAGAFKLTVIRP
jgi:alcohol dehydrogenase